MNEISAEYIKAKELDRRIKTSAQLAQQSLYDMCMGFKEMRDSKLYKELGYQNFEDYCESETGMKRRNVYRYIEVAEKLPCEFVSSMTQIGIAKLQLLATLDAEERTEITENNDLEQTSVRELEEKIKELKSENDKLVDKAYSEKRLAQQMSDRNQELAKKIYSLESEIKELENRPIEVAVETDSKEIENLKDAMKRVDLDWSEKYTELEERNILERRELMQKAEQAEKELDKLSAEKEEKLSALKAELEQTKAEYEKKLAEKPAAAPQSDDKVKFKIYLTAAFDSVKRAVDFAKKSGEQIYIDKIKQLITAVEKELE